MQVQTQMQENENFFNHCRAQNNSWIYAGQDDLSNQFLAGHDQLLEGQTLLIIFKLQNKRIT